MPSFTLASPSSSSSFSITLQQGSEEGSKTPSDSKSNLHDMNGGRNYGVYFDFETLYGGKPVSISIFLGRKPT